MRLNCSVESIRTQIQHIKAAIRAVRTVDNRDGPDAARLLLSWKLPPKTVLDVSDREQANNIAGRALTLLTHAVRQLHFAQSPTVLTAAQRIHAITNDLIQWQAKFNQSNCTSVHDIVMSGLQMLARNNRLLKQITSHMLESVVRLEMQIPKGELLRTTGRRGFLVITVRPPNSLVPRPQTNASPSIAEDASADGGPTIGLSMSDPSQAGDSFRQKKESQSTALPCPEPHQEQMRPWWDRDQKKLRFRGETVREYTGKKPAFMQWQLLDDLQAADWPAEGVETKLRENALTETIKSLNRGTASIHFSGDGSGTRVLWEQI